MSTYANVHIALEQMRVRTLSAARGSPISDEEPDTNPEPPRVLVLGPENSGKTTVCKIFTNYAVRTGQNWSPLLVNVDPSEVCLIFRFLVAIILTLDSCTMCRVVGHVQGQYQQRPYSLPFQHVLRQTR